jgi:hypothetical protein
MLFPFISEMGNSTSVKTEASDSAEQPAAPAPAPETAKKEDLLRLPRYKEVERRLHHAAWRGRLWKVLRSTSAMPES